MSGQNSQKQLHKDVKTQINKHRRVEDDKELFIKFKKGRSGRTRAWSSIARAVLHDLPWLHASIIVANAAMYFVMRAVPIKLRSKGF